MSSMSLMKRFYADRYLHIRSFTINFIVAAAMCAAVWSLQLHDYRQFGFELWHLALIPLGVYLGGMSAVFIHNATHGSFQPAWLNWWAGQLAGLHQLWGFMGWKLIHLIHHQYSDDHDMDPHPPKGRSFWQFTRVMFLHSSAKVSERYREHWGNSRRTYWLHKGVLVTFLGMTVCNLAFWFLLLGPSMFLCFYVPSYIVNHLLFADINYTAHPANEEGVTAAANLNHNLYFKLANFFWCGIYFHGNHHRKPLLFNPRKMQERQPRRERLPDEAEAA